MPPGNCDTNTNSYSYGDCYSHGYDYTNSYSNAYCYRGTEIYSNTETSSHPAAKTIGYRSLGSASIGFARPAFYRTDPSTLHPSVQAY